MNKGHGQSGFSLLEILVAMALVTVVLTMVAGNTFSSRKNLDELMGNVERAIRFSADEAALKNQFVRITFNLEAENQSFNIEYSDDATLVIDPKPPKKSDDEDEEKKTQQSDGFSTVPDFDAEEFDLPIGTRIVAIGSGLTKTLMTEGSPQIYFYPTGEKDSAIIMFATEDEVSYLEVNPFQNIIDRNYIQFDEEIDDENFIEKTLEKAEEIYKEWIAK